MRSALRILAPLLALAVPCALAVACGSDDGGSSNNADGSNPNGEGGLGDGEDGPEIEPTPVTTHPRLFLTQADLPRLRSWAVDSNPIWVNGLAHIAEQARKDMDAGTIVSKDKGGDTYDEYPTEGYAMLFAFLSLVGPDETTRTADAQRARTLLMSGIDKAAGGVSEGKPFQGERFSTNDRSRWNGAGWGLTVDWIYGILSADDKAQIRKVFLRWSDENEKADTTTDNHPVPEGVTNDPKLTSDPNLVRWAANNYYTAHMRNLGLMSVAFDEADDPDGALRAHLKTAIGSWMYVTDALLRGDQAGGLGGEGFEYSPQSVGYVAQFLLALHSAGLDSTANGVQTKFKKNPFWDDSVTGFLHSISPKATTPKGDLAYLGPLYSLVWYGDGSSFWAPDYINLFGAIGAYDQLVGNTARLSKIRWIETNAAPGGADQLNDRAHGSELQIENILYFMIFDPAAPAAEDPRPALPTTFFAPGIGHLFARTDWTPDATWFAYTNGWNTIDHQHADGNRFELYRKGEWLTKERTGYGTDIACSDYKNTLGLQNDVPSHDEGFRHTEYLRGSQWSYSNDGAGKILAQASGAGYVYALGDSTGLYRSTYENATDITHASRSIVWLAPDRVVTYDRATSKTANRFKRYWLNLPANGTVNGKQVTVQTPGGQRLFATGLLPAASTVTVEAVEALGSQPAALDPIKFRMKVEANGGPTNTRFLHVIQGADGGATADAATLVQSTGGTPYEGALVHGVLMMFPVDIGKATSVSYNAPGGTVAQLVTGLEPNAGYTVAQNGASVTITPGGGQNADSGGVLLIGTLP